MNRNRLSRLLKTKSEDSTIYIRLHTSLTILDLSSILDIQSSTSFFPSSLCKIIGRSLFIYSLKSIMNSMSRMGSRRPSIVKESLESKW